MRCCSRCCRMRRCPTAGTRAAAMRGAAVSAGIDLTDLPMLFPKGPRDVAAWFSNRADRQTVIELKRHRIAALKIRERIALGVTTRLAILLPHREAVRCALSLLASPTNVPLAGQAAFSIRSIADSGTPPAIARPISASIRSAGCSPGSMPRRRFIGSTIARTMRRRRRRFLDRRLRRSAGGSRNCASAPWDPIRCGF